MGDSDKPTNLIALKRAREQGTELVMNRYAEGLFDDDDLERRLEVLQKARTMEEVESVTVDLRDPDQRPAPAPAVTAPSPVAKSDKARVPASRAASPVAPAAPGSAPENVFALFSQANREGLWRPAHLINATAIMGETVLDFRDAEMLPGATRVQVFALMGAVKIIVPPGMAVENQIVPMMGGVERDRDILQVAADDEEPSLRLTGLAFMGGVEVRERLSGESGKEARKRLKKDGKRRHKESKKALKQLRREVEWEEREEREERRRSRRDSRSRGRRRGGRRSRDREYEYEVEYYDDYYRD